MILVNRVQKQPLEVFQRCQLTRTRRVSPTSRIHHPPAKNFVFSPIFLPFHPHFYLFTHISSSLSLYVENFKQIISSHWSEVLCVLFKAWTNFASVLLSLFTQKRARSRISEVDFKQNYLNKNICLIGKLFDLTDCLVKNRFKFTGFSLLRKLAHMHAHHFLMDR